jgi:hypothetical protein
MFHMDVEKVDRNIAYVVMAAYVCCKHLFSMFHLFFGRTLQVCLFGYCICFTHMLQVFYLDVAYVMVYKCFSGVFCKYFRCMFQVFSSVFRRMLQLLHLNVSKVDRCCTCCNVTHLL